MVPAPCGSLSHSSVILSSDSSHSNGCSLPITKISTIRDMISTVPGPGADGKWLLARLGDSPHRLDQRPAVLAQPRRRQRVLAGQGREGGRGTEPAVGH